MKNHREQPRFFLFASESFKLQLAKTFVCKRKKILSVSDDFFILASKISDIRNQAKGPTYLGMQYSFVNRKRASKKKQVDNRTHNMYVCTLAVKKRHILY